MKPLQLFRKRVDEHRDRLMTLFGIIKKYPVESRFMWDAVQTEKVSSDPHDHAVHAEVDLSDDFAFVYGVQIDAVGVMPDDQTSKKVKFSDLITPETDVFKVDVDVKSIAQQDAVVHLGGTIYGGTSLELSELDGGIIMEVWGLKRADLPCEFYKETMAEAFCLELECRCKQSFFSYMTALDSLVNFRLADIAKFKELEKPVTQLHFKEKVALTIKRSLDKDEIASLPLAQTITSKFATLVDTRNTIAHSIKRVEVKDDDIGDSVFLLLTLMMIIEKRTADATLLAKHYNLKGEAKESDCVPRSD